MTDSLAALASFASQAAAARWEGASVDSLQPLEGGHSSVTVSGVLHRPGRADQSIAIKAAPPGRVAYGRHDVLRQARLFEALSGQGVPVPEVFFSLSAGDRGRTATLFGMEFLSGECWEPVLEPDAPRPAGIVTSRAETAAQILARLHRVPWQALPQLRNELVSSIHDELRRWTVTMDAVPSDLRAGSDELGGQLRSAVPAAMDPVLVHGDYRLGNVLFDQVRATAVIDWEIWAITDPRIDLGWFLTFCDASCFPGVGIACDGMPSASVLLGHYSEQYGVTLPDMAWFDAFGRFKMAAIMGHNLKRHREGRHDDPFQERLPQTISTLIAAGRERLE